MQNYGQFRVGIRIGNQIQFRFAMRQWWPHVVAVLRTGCIKTTGHPFQVHAGVPAIFIGFPAFPCAAVHGPFSSFGSGLDA